MQNTYWKTETRNTILHCRDKTPASTLSLDTPRLGPLHDCKSLADFPDRLILCKGDTQRDTVHRGKTPASTLSMDTPRSASTLSRDTPRSGPFHVYESFANFPDRNSRRKSSRIENERTSGEAENKAKRRVLESKRREARFTILRGGDISRTNTGLTGN